MGSTSPESDVELHTDEALLDPYPRYKTLRKQGAAVWLTQYNMFALSRYKDVREALGSPKIFSSSKGIALNERMNEALSGPHSGGTLCSDAPRHDILRKIIEKPLTPKALAQLRERITTEAEKHVEKLVAKKSFDVATELSQHLPVTIVSELVGLPEEGRERMLDWAPASFDCFGPINQRMKTALPVLEGMTKYVSQQCVLGKLKQGGWAAMIWEAVDRGEIDPEDCLHLMNDYLVPSLDTTIFATTSAIWLFAKHPEQWDIVRKNPSLIPQAINEAVRLESPIQGFSRVVTQDHEIEGVTLPKGSRALVLYASANRDEQKWDNPEEFNVHNDARGHMGFGFGDHQCVGNNLARLEMRALLAALAKRVKRFELGTVERGLNNILRGIAKCEVTVH